jgi:uncharacterized membrane protein YjfL (UPF0719 family)
MQYFTLIGGFIGFALTLAASILAGKELGTSVFNATVGCVIIAFLFRGLHFVTVFCAKQVVSERTRLRNEEMAAATEEAAALEKIQSEEAASTPSNTPA